MPRLIGLVIACAFILSSLVGCSAYGYLRLDSEPTRARVFENGRYIGTTPLEYNIGAIPEEYLFSSDDRIWDPGLEFTANKAGYAEGTLHPRINTKGIVPDNARHPWDFVFILEPRDGGTSNQAQQQQQQQQQMVVLPGSQPEVAQTGTVIISSNVTGADVNVDGVFVGNAPANLKLKDGIHIIEVKKDGYPSYRRELRVLSGSDLSIRAELSR